MTFDLRGVGHWPMWVALPPKWLLPGDVVEALNIRFCPGFSLVITGGRRGRTPSLLHIEDGDLLEAFLKQTTDITPTSEGDSDGTDPRDGSDGSSDTDGGHGDRLPDSSDFDASPPRGPRPWAAWPSASISCQSAAQPHAAQEAAK